MPRSPAAKEIPIWVQDYQRRIEQARLEHQQMKPIEYPQEAEEGQGEFEMPDANSNLVQKQLSEHAQQVVHIVHAGNEEKEILEDEFESVKANIEIVESRIHTDKQRVDMEVAGVGSQMQLQEAVLQEIRSGVNILQAQDNQIVAEANSIFEAHKLELEAISKRVTSCDCQILSIKGTNIGIQRSLNDMNSKIAKVNEVFGSIKSSLKEVPSRKELKDDATTMDEQLVRMQEVNTGLTPAMEGYRFSES
jgi:predicted  nucleic acid-binding Zn-ribbon protein